MKKFFPVKMLFTLGFKPPVSNMFSIKKEKIFKVCFFYFKNEEQFLKDTDSLFAIKKSGHSLAKTDHQATHSAL